MMDNTKDNNSNNELNNFDDTSSRDTTVNNLSDNKLSKDATSTHQTESASSPVQDLEAVYDVPVQISAVLGRSTMPVHKLLKLGRGAVVELDRRVGEAIDIYVNNRLIARGEVVVVDDHLGVTMTEIIKSDRS